MRITVIGLGYVGAVCAACFASMNHKVIGIDISKSKVDKINNKQSPILEEGLEELISKHVELGNLSATTNGREAIINSEISFVCVGTPSKRNGDLDLTYLKNVCCEIGEALRDKNEDHIVVIRSTILPGIIRDVIIPTIELNANKKIGKGFNVIANPEFLRETSAIKDFHSPSMTIIGGIDKHSMDIISELYTLFDTKIIHCSFEVASMIKYACNAWHAVKISFANEIGTIAKSCGVDGRQVMDILCLDTKLNTSKYYLKPGFAFGGSCLPKDIRALNYKTKQLDANTPLLESVLESNKIHINRAFDIISSYKKRAIGLIGLSYKSDSDDLRDSPLVELAEMLIGKGFDLKIFDNNVHYASLFGANKDYINERIPHISILLCETHEEIIQHSDIIIFGHKNKQIDNIFQNIPSEKQIIDLIGLMNGEMQEKQEGICW
jgi:nucleotide sugar dehydrogenase